MSALRPGSCRMSPRTPMGATRTSATTTSSTRTPRTATAARSRWRPTRALGPGGGRHHHRGHVVALGRLAAELDDLVHDALDRGGGRAVAPLAPPPPPPLLPPPPPTPPAAPRRTPARSCPWPPRCRR